MSCKDEKAWLKTVPLKPLYDNNVKRIVIFLGLNFTILLIPTSFPESTIFKKSENMARV